MFNRFGAGTLLLLWIIGCTVVFVAFVRISVKLEQAFGKLWVGSIFGIALFLAFLVFYRLLQDWVSSRQDGASLSEWQPLSAVDALYAIPTPKRTAGQDHSMMFSMSPGPWVKLGVLTASLVSSVLLIVLLLLLLFAPAPAHKLPFPEGFMVLFVILAVWALSALFLGVMFLLNRRVIGFGLGTHGCNFRLVSPNGADLRSIVETRHGAFRIDDIERLWSREQLSSHFKWPETHYGITFKAGDQLRLGSTTRYSSLSHLGDLHWETLLTELSRRTEVAISREKLHS